MVDQAALNGLYEYRESLEKCLEHLHEAHENIVREWVAFERLYEGDAAREFKDLWRRATTNFEEYLERSQDMMSLLDERITFLQTANRD